MTMLSVLVLAQIMPGSVLNHRTPTVEAALNVFRADWAEAKAALAPDVPARLELPDDEVRVEGQRFVAWTQWTGFEFVTRADWRALMERPATVRRHVAIHEVCHLLDAATLKSDTLTASTRRMLESRAEECVVTYWVARTMQ